MMFLPKSSFDQLLTETNCFFVGQRNLTCCWFVSSSQNYIERQFKISFAWSLWAIFGPQTRYGHWLGPHLDDGSAKKLEISFAWSVNQDEFVFRQSLEFDTGACLLQKQIRNFIYSNVSFRTYIRTPNMVVLPP